MTNPDTELLQGVERAVEQIRLLSDLVHRLIDAMQRGDSMPEAQLRTYLEQLGNIDAGTVRLDGLIRSLWQLKGMEDGVQ